MIYSPAKKRFALCLVLALIIAMQIPLFAAQPITTPPTGFQSAEDVVYVKDGAYVANWGARNEPATFLSTYASAYYTGDNAYPVLSEKADGQSASDAPSSELYAALRDLMASKQTHKTDYQETRDLFRYTDCVQSDTKHISSFYSGTELNGTWDSAKTWNREHTWPKSKGRKGDDSNDIMMLRPTSVKENSSRGNTAYGEGSSFFDPGASSRGDCARIVLYVYVRWGVTDRMWGADGVMESLPVLLKWMQEDPVDTWEMGRNDTVESITGVRNVFVDYPEYAWLLFGETIPADMTTPSGAAQHPDTAPDTTVSDTETTPAPDTLVTTPAVTTPAAESAPETTAADPSGCASTMSIASCVLLLSTYTVLKKRRIHD